MKQPIISGVYDRPNFPSTWNSHAANISAANIVSQSTTDKHSMSQPRRTKHMRHCVRVLSNPGCFQWWKNLFRLPSFIWQVTINVWREEFGWLLFVATAWSHQFRHAPTVAKRDCNCEWKRCVGWVSLEYVILHYVCGPQYVCGWPT